MHNAIIHRRSLRLRGYDYSTAGAYFVTICAQDRACVFGDVADDAMVLNDAGQMVAALWAGIPARFPKVEIDRFVVMPNHLHGILFLPDTEDAGATMPDKGATTRVAPTSESVGAPLVGAPMAHVRLGDIVGAFKSLTTVAYIDGVNSNGWPEFRGRLWQRNYYEHIIRDEPALNRIRRYVEENPARWDLDEENPQKAMP
ncbi:hypothetical protein JQ628_33760 [Bradyrhizobium lablabi]|uniref:transposase n=1 Tax=Bradyrhizobium lablabi TaxID=722472 RepID=UPI001BA5AF3D|nr:transposase [Bradyrhizobium lablabi]MBR1126529.1 hypothetical protein [Bradyrhizobium lablabi]